MNKMTETKIHKVLDGVKDGDILRVTLTIEGVVKDKNIHYPFVVGIKGKLPIRYANSDLATNLTYVEIIEKPEPELGSFALLHDRYVIQRGIGGWYGIKSSLADMTWDEVKPRIKILYNPDGSVKEGWK